MIDFEKSEKLPKDRRYFNISIIWIFYFRWIIRILYYLKIPHELVTLTSIGLGIYSAYLFLEGQFVVAAVALHFKDIFDASDGALARLTGRGHLIGRYLDSLGDFLSLTLVMAAIAYRAVESGNEIYYLWGSLAILSTFIQCSLFNYYQLKYVETFGIDSLSSKTDENNRSDIDHTFENRTARLILKTLRLFYKIIYSWQDRLIDAIDGRLAGVHDLSRADKYGNRHLMILQSALCFGTHIFVIIIFALLKEPKVGLIFISVVMNIYMIILLYLRKRHYRIIQHEKLRGKTALETV